MFLKTLVTTYKTTRYYKPEDHNPYISYLMEYGYANPILFIVLKRFQNKH
jgi:hypothetical protein